MFFLFPANVRLARPVFTIAKYAFSNPVTRSFITSSRVADVKQPKPNAASPKTTTEKKSKREKPEKKVNKPKKLVITDDMKPPPKPHNAYVRFVKEYYEKHPKPSSRAETQTMMKLCAAEWHTLSDAAKAAYGEGYNQEIEEYRKKKAAWIESIDLKTAIKINKARKAAGKSSMGFKTSDRPNGPYIRFFMHFYKSLDQQYTLAAHKARAIGEAWRSLSQDEKQQYFDSYARDRDEWLGRKASDKA